MIRPVAPRNASAHCSCVAVDMSSDVVVKPVAHCWRAKRLRVASDGPSSEASAGLSAINDVGYV